MELGDLDPSRRDVLLAGLRAPGVSGVQCDFDDGFCPSWGNVLVGLRNLAEASRLYRKGATAAATLASLVFRPRAWNMVERNFRVGGRAVPGPLFDLGVFSFHCAARLHAAAAGPFLYLSKLESAAEASVWASAFAFAAARLPSPVPASAFRVTVLVESIPLAFEMHELAWALRDNLSALNAGMVCVALVLCFPPSTPLRSLAHTTSMLLGTTVGLYCERRAQAAPPSPRPLAPRRHGRGLQDSLSRRLPPRARRGGAAARRARHGWDGASRPAPRRGE